MIIQKIGKVRLALLAANLGVWIYFWIAFALASEPYSSHHWVDFPVDPYCLWGHAIGLTKSAFTYPFMNLIFWTEFPSFSVAVLFERVFLGRGVATDFYAGISTGGYKLLLTMGLSFLPWYLIGTLIQHFTRRDSGSSPTRGPQA